MTSPACVECLPIRMTSWGASRVESATPATGSTEGGLEHYLTALEMYEQLAGEFPADLDLRKAIANNHMHLGDVYGRTGDMDSAMRHYTTALDIAESARGMARCGNESHFPSGRPK